MEKIGTGTLQKMRLNAPSPLPEADWRIKMAEGHYPLPFWSFFPGSMCRVYKSHGDGSWTHREFHHDPKDSTPCLTCLTAQNVVIEESVKIFHPNLIKIGSGTYVGNGTILKGYPLTGSEKLPSIEIGNDCWIGENAYFHGAGHIKIENRVGIGPGVYILTSFHESSGTDSLLNRPIEFKPVTLREGCDIEARAFICAGVTVGRGAIVRAGSVVTKNVADYEIVAGNPAKFISFRANDEAHFLMKSM